jgi:hypothetical protein
MSRRTMTTKRRVAPFKNAITSKPKLVLSTRNHGVRPLEILVSSLDTKLLPRWKIIAVTHAVRTSVPCYRLTVCGRATACDGFIPHGRSNADAITYSNYPNHRTTPLPRSSSSPCTIHPFPLVRSPSAPTTTTTTTTTNVCSLSSGSLTTSSLPSHRRWSSCHFRPCRDAGLSFSTASAATATGISWQRHCQSSCENARASIKRAA